MNKKLNSSIPLYKLDKPDLSKINKEKILSELDNSPNKYRQILTRANEPRYIYWDEFKYKFRSDKLNIVELWYLVRQFRDISSIATPVQNEQNEPFKWLRLHSTDQYLHEIDMLTGGQLFPRSDIVSEKNQQIYVNRGIIEEAIASSQLEGAHTTRKAARKMLLEKLPPRNSSEQMIVNNFNTINSIEQDYKNQKLSKPLLFELHRQLTKNTVKKTEQNRFRKNKDNIVVRGQVGKKEYISHLPPDEKFVKKSIQKLIDYANDQNDTRFIHPVIKAIFLHFWIGYLHPFTDGNGRLARALFYWYLLRKGYWTLMYLPISVVIKKSPNQYAMAYIYTEQDNHDLTYFYDFHIRKILQAINEFQTYIDKKIEENKEISQLVSKQLTLNSRQKQLLHYLATDPSTSTTIKSQTSFNKISRQTAAKDLKKLENAGLIRPRKEGKYKRYYPTEKLLKIKE